MSALVSLHPRYDQMDEMLLLAALMTAAQILSHDNPEGAKAAARARVARIKAELKRRNGVSA